MRKKLKILLPLLTIFWMVMIFQMSAAPMVESDAMSSGLSSIICGIFIPGFEDMSLAQQKEIMDGLSYPVRKMAHFTEYTILGMLLFSDFQLAVHFTRAFSAYAAFFTAALYAVSDEIHQLFVSGRSGQVSDVLLDAGGAAFGAAIGYFLIFKNHCSSQMPTDQESG